MNIIDRQVKINLTSTPSGYQFNHQCRDYQFPTLEKVHEFFFTETKLDTVKLCHQGKKSYVHFSIDEIETFTSKKALRRILSQESEGAWIEKRDGKKKYFVDNGWLFSSIKKVSKEEYQNRPEKGLTFQKVLGVALGLFAIAPAAVECARRMPVGTQEAAMGLIAMQHRSPLLAVLGYSLLPQLSRAQAAGMEFQVNNYVLNDQSAPNVAPLKDGGFLVTWRSYGQDGDGYGIYAKRYNANGIQIGLEFRVNSNTTNSQSDPCAASLNDGGFVIAWTSNGQDGDGSGIYAQRYDATSIRIGTEFRVNNYTTNNQYSPRVAPLEDGGFIIVWTSEYQDGDFTGVYGQRYNVSGLKNSAEFLVNTQTLNLQQDPSITALKNKKVIVAWTSYGQDGDSGGTYAQMYDASIVPNGTEFRVNTYTTGTQGYPSIAALMDGGFVITWLSFAQDGDGSGVFGQKYDFNRAQIGLEFQINNYTTNPQQKAQVAHFGNLGFVVTWMSYGQDGDLDGIFAQIFDIIGLKNGTEFQVNNYTTSEQSNPSIALLEYGGFVIIWQSQDQDGSGNGIFGQRFDANGTPIPLIIAPNNPTSNIPTPNFSASITSPSSANSQSSNPTPSITTIASPTSNTPTSSFSASITSPSSANSQSSNPTPSITVIASSILSTPSGASSAQIGSSTNINPQQTPTTAPPGSSQNPTPVIPSPISQFSPSINPVRLTPSPISSPTPPFPAPSVLLTSNPDSSSNPASSSEVICGQDCETSNTRLIGGLLGGIVGIVTIAGGVFAVYKWKNRKKDISDDIESVEETHPGSIKMEKTSQSALTPIEQVEESQEHTYVPLNRLDGFDPMPEVLKQPNPAAPFKVEDFPSIAELSFIPIESEPLISTKIGSKEGNRYILLEQVDPEKQLALRKATGVTLKFDDKNVAYIGTGAHAVVKIAQQSKTKAYVAAKEIRNTPQVPNAIGISAREGEILKQLQGVPNIIQLYNEYYIKNKETLYQFMCLAGFGDGSTLAQKLSGQVKRIRSAILVEAAKELLKGVIGMQERHIYHFDLKPSNFVFDMQGTLFIADFGSAKELEQGMLKEYVYADAYYFSPERIELSRTEYNNRTTRVKQKIKPISAEKSESWSLGVSLLEMIKGYNCFQGNDPVLERNENFLEEITEQELQDIDAPEVIKEIIQGFLKIDPNERMSILEAYERIKETLSFKNAEEKMNVFAKMKGLKVDFKHRGQE